MNWLWGGEVPIVFTGAQRPADHEEPDGHNNLSQSLMVAGDEKAKGQGVFICFHGLLLTARQAAKVHSGSLGGVWRTGGQPDSDL